MTGEYAIAGIFVAAAPLHALVALALVLLIHRMLVRTRFYRWVWHPVLVDSAMFAIAWALVALWLPLFLQRIP